MPYQKHHYHLRNTALLHCRQPAHTRGLGREIDCSNVVVVSRHWWTARTALTCCVCVHTVSKCACRGNTHAVLSRPTTKTAISPAHYRHTTTTPDDVQVSS
ncbi:unnamed protein product, partial [Ectocarpus fasciculatus]